MGIRVETDESTELADLREQVSQLQGALNSRVVIEQAKGMLAERLQLTVDDAFLLLRYAARSTRTNLHDLAHHVVSTRVTPRSVTVAVARQQRWRAAGQRERAEAHRERAHIEAERVRGRAQRVRKTVERPPGSQP